MYKLLARLLLSNPQVLFSVVAVVAVALTVVAYLAYERRQRRLAEIAEEDGGEGGELRVSQRRRVAAVAGVGLGLLGVAGWWFLLRVHTEDDRVFVAIRVEEEAGDGDNQWWHGHAGALELASGLAEELDALGLEVVEPREGGDWHMAWAQAEPEALVSLGRRHQARWVIDGRITPLREIGGPEASTRDFVLDVEVALIDAKSGERHPVPDMPLHALLWGSSVDDAVASNAGYLVGRITMPLVASLAGHPDMQAYRAPDPDATIEAQLRIDRLTRLFAREHDHAEAVGARAEHRAQAEARVPAERAAVPRIPLGDVLAQEWVVGTLADGRLVILADPKHLSATPDRIGYVLTSEGEHFVLADSDGAGRELLFEHYNIYGSPAVTPGGDAVWTVLSNHGASRTLGVVDAETGDFSALHEDPRGYFSAPVPDREGARATVLWRPGRNAHASLVLVDREGDGQIELASADDRPGASGWSPDGRWVYMVLYAPTPAVYAVDLDAGQGGGVRELLVGESGDAFEARLAHAQLVAEARETLAALAIGAIEIEDADHLQELRDLVSEADDAAADPEAAQLRDPVTSSAFLDVAVSHDGAALYVIELARAADGSEQRAVGRFDLAERSYTRLAALDAESILASPVDDRVAVVVRRHAASPVDPDRSDREILVLGPRPEDRLLVTDNGVDDYLTAWSRDGRHLFSYQVDRDPGSRKHGVTRSYRHDLP